MKREEWKRSYKRICCLLAAIGAGTALCGCSPGNGTQAVRRLEEVRFPAEPVYKNSEERWEAERNQSLPEAFLAAYSDFSYGTAAELLKDKKENTAYSPLGLYYALAAAAQGAEGKTEEEFLSLLGYDSVQELAKDCKSSFEILYHVPNKKNRTGAGEEPHTSSLYSLQIANSLWADDSLPLKEGCRRPTGSWRSEENRETRYGAPLRLLSCFSYWARDKGSQRSFCSPLPAPGRCHIPEGTGTPLRFFPQRPGPLPPGRNKGPGVNRLYSPFCP